MKCFRCEGLDFDVIIHSFMGNAVVGCTSCKQTFSVGEKLHLDPIEVLGNPKEIINECIIKQCSFCPTKRFIAVDCTHLNMQSCGFCNLESTPVGDKIPLEEFLNRTSGTLD